MVKIVMALIVALHVVGISSASVGFEEIFEIDDGTVYDSRDLSTIPPPEFMAQQIERWCIQDRVDYAEDGPILRWLVASLDCPSNATYRAEYKKNIDSWLPAVTNWPGVLTLKAELDLTVVQVLFDGVPWLDDNLDHADKAVAKQALLEHVTRGISVAWEPEESEIRQIEIVGSVDRAGGELVLSYPQEKEESKTDPSRLTATIDSVDVRGDEVEVRFTLENKTGSHLWIPAMPECHGLFRVTRVIKSAATISSDILKSGKAWPPSWRLFYAWEKETRTVVFKIGEKEQYYRNAFWKDPLVRYALKKHGVRFFGDTAVGTFDEGEIWLELTLDNPEYFEWFKAFEEKWMPPLPPLKNTRPSHYPATCTGIDCEPVAVKINLPPPQAE